MATVQLHIGSATYVSTISVTEWLLSHKCTEMHLCPAEVGSVGSAITLMIESHKEQHAVFCSE